MCDPISLALIGTGAALTSYGQSQVASKQKQDITSAQQAAQAARTQQQGYNAQNQATVADTLNQYSAPSQAADTAKAVASRSSAYTAPLQAKNFVADMPADFDPNNIVAARNAFTGNTQQQKSIAQALAKAKLDAYGDVQTQTAIGAQNNADQIATTNRIANTATAAANQRQAVLPQQLAGDENAGQTAGTLGGLFTMAGMMGAGHPGAFGSLAGQNVPASTFSTGAVDPDFSGVPTSYSLPAIPALGGTGILGGLQSAYRSYVSPMFSGA